MFSYLNGGLVSYRYGGVEMIEMIPKPNFWRAPNDNDCGNLMPMRYAQWKIASMYLSHKYPTGGPYPASKEPEIEVTKEWARITFTYCNADDTGRASAGFPIRSMETERSRRLFLMIR